MPRIARKDLDGKYYHVMVQGIGKEFVFPDDHCKGFYLTCLRENKIHYPAKILAFCVMGNHAHILLSVVDAQELALYFKRVNADYARYYNRINNRVGYVFRDRFKSEMIRSERQLVYCMAYIQNNPLKAGMVKKAEDYPFSSYSNYLRRTGIVDFDEAAIFYDIAPENITAIMGERTDTSWLEHDDKEYEDCEKVFLELNKDYKITPGRNMNVNQVRKLVEELKDRSGASIRDIAVLLGVSREKLRNMLRE
ncbi:MAG: transposase [Firmicutes bacterium]|nr:transposase [Bacillota bacterium]